MESMIVLLGADILDYVDKHMYLFQAYTGRPAGFTDLQINYKLSAFYKFDPPEVILLQI